MVLEFHQLDQRGQSYHALSVGGLAILIGLLAVMQEAHLGMALYAVFTALSFLILIGANSVFIRLLLRSKRGAYEATEKDQVKGITARELGPTQVGVFLEPGLSVTEHTTRTLEPASSEHKTE